jgi:hypothetical protein
MSDMSTSLIAKLTNTASTRPWPLTDRDAILILTRVYTRLLYTTSEDPMDFVSRLDAERDLLRLRSELHVKVFGTRV